MRHLLLLLVLLILALTILTACKDPETGDELICPECGSEDVIPIAYGKPGAELAEAAERGEVFLGGCMISEDSPNWHCKACGAQWK